MSVLILDAGNSIIKAKIGRREFGELAFPPEPGIQPPNFWMLAFAVMTKGCA